MLILLVLIVKDKWLLRLFLMYVSPLGWANSDSSLSSTATQTTSEGGSLDHLQEQRHSRNLLLKVVQTLVQTKVWICSLPCMYSCSTWYGFALIKDT